MIQYHLISCKGERVTNEDYVGMYEKEGEYCFLLADGLGGHGKGEIASELVVTQGIVEFEKGQFFEAIPQAFEVAQEKLLEKQKMESSPTAMKTTMVMLCIGKKGLYWGHVGDSRLYYFRKNKLIKRTLDHSVPQMLVASGEIKEKDIRGHEDRNRLLRVMGTPWVATPYEIEEVHKVQGKQAFLLCSDGFWELIEEKKMIGCLKKADTVEQWIEMMEEIVKERGMGQEMDNYSAVGIWID